MGSGEGLIHTSVESFLRLPRGLWKQRPAILACLSVKGYWAQSGLRRGLSLPALAHLQSQLCHSLGVTTQTLCTAREVHSWAGYSWGGPELMVAGLKTSLQEPAVPGRQHKMESNPAKKANCRAEQSLGGCRGGKTAAGQDPVNSFPVAWEFVVGCPEIFPAKPLCLMHVGYLCLGVIVIVPWFYHHLTRSGIPSWHPSPLPARSAPKATRGPWIVFQAH